jgi:hypothetical protein
MRKIIPVSTQERKAIIAALSEITKEGLPSRSIYSISKEYRRSPDTILRIRDAAGLDRSPNKKGTESATMARGEFNAARRRALIARLSERIAEVAETTMTAQGMQQIAIAAGIVVDKARLEEGKATGINEERGTRPLAQLADEELRALEARKEN